jgi:hypothetical protein
MESQLWLLHQLKEATWLEFIAAHRGNAGEMAFHRVGSFYDRVGTLVRLDLINDQEILTTIGGYAIAVWQRVEPLVHEARRIENSTLFADFERLLPACHECYVPALSGAAIVSPFSVPVAEESITPQVLKRRLDAHEPLTVLDVRAASQWQADPRTLPNAQVVSPQEIERTVKELHPAREIVVYCA